MHAGHNAGRALTCEATHARHLQAHGGHLEEDDEDDDQQDEDDDDDDDEDDDDEFATPHQGVVIEELEDGPAPAAVRTESRKQDIKRGMQVQLPLHQGRVIEELEDGPTPAAVAQGGTPLHSPRGGQRKLLSQGMRLCGFTVASA